MPRSFVLISLALLSTGCARHATGTSTVAAPYAWEVIPLAPDKAANTADVPSRAILLNKQTGETWIQDNPGNVRAWYKMSRE